MKELREYFEYYTTLYTNLSSYMCFVKAVKHEKPSDRIITAGFNELVERKDYSPSDRYALLKGLRSIKISE